MLLEIMSLDIFQLTFTIIIHSFQYQQQHTVKMSLKFENSQPLALQQLKTDRKVFKHVQSPLSNQGSSFRQETERLFNNNRLISVLKDQQFFQKQTERNNSYHRQNIVWMTDSNSSKSQHESNWSINLNNNNSKQKICEIYSLLHQRQLVQTFEAFQQLRFIIDDELQGPHSKLTSKIVLLEAIEALRCKMQAVVSDEHLSVQIQTPNKIKQMLEQISLLRSQNAILKQRLQRMYRQFKEEGFVEEDNSILNNSISFHSCNSQLIGNDSEQSFELKLDNELVKPFIIAKEVCEQSTFGLLTDSGNVYHQNHEVFLNSTTHCLNSFVISSPNHRNHERSLETSIIESSECQFQEQKWIEMTQNCLKGLKKLMKYYIQAVNLAIMTDEEKIRQLNLLVQRINQYRPLSVEQRQETFLSQSNQFVKFISCLASEVHLLIEESFLKMTNYCFETKTRQNQ